MYKSYFTYGFELELVDVDRRTRLPNGCTWNNAEITLVNSNGQAVHSHNPKKWLGGEINTKPTRLIAEQLDLIKGCLRMLPNANVNYRCNTQVTVGFDKSKFTVEDAKLIVRYAYENYDTVIEACGYKTYTFAKEQNYTESEVEKISKADSFKTLYRLLFTSDTGVVSPFSFRRRYVNIQSIFKYGAVEFRHFHGSKDIDRIKDCFVFASTFIRHALSDQEPVSEWIDEFKFPEPLPFDPELERVYRKTKAVSTVVKPLKVATTKYYTKNNLNYR